MDKSIVKNQELMNPLSNLGMDKSIVKFRILQIHFQVQEPTNPLSSLGPNEPILWLLDM